MDAFLLTLDRRSVKIHSVERVQNVSLWQSYCVKKASIIAREDDPVAAARFWGNNFRATISPNMSPSGELELPICLHFRNVFVNSF